MSKIIFSYVQRIYYWNYETFSYITSFGMMKGLLSSILAIPFLSKVCSFSDIDIAMIGIMSIFSGSLSFGSILNPIGIYIRMVVSIFGVYASVSLRAHTS